MAQLLYIVASLHVMLCPFTKVEESFNIQAFHDILYHRHNLSQYDHNEFPGVVPRTFVGPLVISALSAPVVGFLHLCGVNKFWMQYIVRSTLALVVIVAWSRLRDTLQKQYGSAFAWWFTIITVSQYHFMFYLSRALPNIMVMPLVLLAFEGWISGRHKQFLISAGAGIIIFRSELAMLFGLFLIIDIYFKKVTVTNVLKTIVPAGIGLVALTLIVDSIFWARPIWPEAQVFYYNTILNKSANWGTSPFLWYFYSALTRGLGPSLLLIPVGIYLDKRMVPFAAPAFVYIILYSFLPHKELRFIIYVFPLLNMVSAAACSYIFLRRTKSPIFELSFWGIVLIILGNIVLTIAFTSVAMTNYPGGVAITRFHKHLKGEPFVNVHIDNLAAQTGVTRFTQYDKNWIYSKNESLELAQLKEYTHLLIEAKSKYSSNIKYFSNSHVILDTIEAFSNIALTYKLFPPIRIKTKPTIYILERKDFREDPKGHAISVDSNEVEELSSEFNSEEKYIDIDIIKQEIATKSNDLPLADFPETVDDVSTNTVLDEKDVENNIETDQLDPNSIRKERKKRAIAKIKTETRKEVVASAKEKLREIMKRHSTHEWNKRISKLIIEGNNLNTADKSVVETEILEQEVDIDDIKVVEALESQDNTKFDKPITLLDNTEDIDLGANMLETEDIKDDVNLEYDDIVVSITPVSTEIIEDENVIEKVDNKSEFSGDIDNDINSIVEEVIVRLVDRKIYEDKENITAEERQIIQQIVEEVVLERIN